MFFFFKQKTAYEMRISDWSSDVCSSDLAVPVDRGVLVQGVGHVDDHVLTFHEAQGRPRHRAVDGKSGSLLVRDVDGGLADGKVVGTRQGGWNAEQRRDHPDGRIGRQGVDRKSVV